MKKDALFCVGQKAFIEKNGKVLVLNDPLVGLDFPGGKIQEGEAQEGDFNSLIDALKREVREETGLEIEVFEPFAVWYRKFLEKNHRNYGKEVYLVAFSCKYVSGEIKLSEEHNKFKWVDRSDYKELNDGSEYFNALEKYFKK
ncbi:MAG: NUDIX domain-containing protein [Patescibacteria group bacterium]